MMPAHPCRATARGNQRKQSNGKLSFCGNKATVLSIFYQYADFLVTLAPELTERHVTESGCIVMDNTAAVHSKHEENTQGARAEGAKKQHPPQVVEYLDGQGDRGPALIEAIDAYRDFARALDCNNRLHTTRKHPASKYSSHSGQGRILAALAQEDDVTQAQLAAQLQAAPQTVSAAICKLMREGLIERLPDPLDARVWRITLTADGRKAALRLCDEAQHPCSVFDALDDDELAQFNELTGKLVKRLEQEIDLSDAPSEQPLAHECPRYTDVASFPLTNDKGDASGCVD